jgi:hypothetical protein
VCLKLSILASCAVVPLLQHTIGWRIVEAWALHVCCSCWWLTAIRLVHTVCDIQHQCLIITAQPWNQTFIYFMYLLFVYLLLFTSYLFTCLCIYLFIYVSMYCDGQSQWPHSLRHELSLLAQTLGSWVRIPLKAWMSVLCAFILCFCCSVCR